MTIDTEINSLNEIHQKIIGAVINKAEAVCPDSLALIGIYGSVATGDTHERSDLDLMILINNDRGHQLSEAFILDDVGVGYDIYCTTWQILEADADCSHAHLSKLLDSVLIYVKDQNAVKRLEQLRKSASERLVSDERFSKALAAFDNAKRQYANCFLSDSLSSVRSYAGAAVNSVMDAVMLYHGRYFKNGIKRRFEEICSLHLSFDIQGIVMNIIRSQTSDEIRNALTELMRAVQEHLNIQREKAAPNKDNIGGTYEEMFSNWRNKMHEAAYRDDLFSSFMNMLNFADMIDEIAEYTDINDPAIMDSFDPFDLRSNAAAFDRALEKYLEEYKRAGIEPKRYANVDDLIDEYLKQ